MPDIDCATPFALRQAQGEQSPREPFVVSLPNHERLSRNEEFDDLVALLLDHAVHPSEELRLLARLIAHACMGQNHLWQDLGLPNRQVLNELMRDCFPTLHARNSGNMRWKKFFYRQLCERAEVLICKSPSCGVCCDYAECFGPEDGPGPMREPEAALAL